ncbi:MAG: hypothetical protein JXR62_03100 [Bacilli bacterium]|nr:hypothetical protein [Bacilli bacterium]
MDLILYNPLSKNSKSNIQTHKLVRYYKKNNIPFRLKSILKIDDMRDFLETKQQFNKVILLGGDGTINHFVNNTIDYAIRQDIYLKKNGSGNDFLRSLKGNDQNPQYIMESTYDTGYKTFFINGTGMGIDGYVGYLINQSPRKGKLSYLLNTLKALIKYIPEPLKVTIDGTEHQFKKAYLVTMNNGRYFGGGMQISPEAKIDDEYLDVIVCHTISKLFILPIFFTIYLGKHTLFKKYVFHQKGKIVKAEFATPQITQADGENYYDITSIEAKSSNKKIHLKSFDM